VSSAHRSKLTRLTLATALAVAAAGTAGSAAASDAKPNIVQLAASDPNLTTLVSLVQTAGLADTLATTSKITVFAPTNAAFDALPRATVARIASNPQTLRKVLRYHVAKNRLTAYRISKLHQIRSLQGERIRVSTMGGELRLNANTKVVAANLMAKNGVAHVVDRVLLPRSERDLVTWLSAKSEFTTLVSLVQQAGLTEAVASGELTLFAPTNAAFAKLPPATLQAVAGDPELLKKVLTYHVVAGRVSAKQALAAGTAATLNGASVKITRHHGRVMINDARVIRTDIPTVNGVVHVIDRVLVPAS
jgi:transforming growth factor-beta-induced protein